MYVIYVSSELTRHDSSNAYDGYWEGKTYTREGSVFPVCGREPKTYKSKARAESMGEKLIDRCTYVMSAYVEEEQN